MPVTVTMKLKRVTNNETNDLVVSIYKDALRQKNMLNEDESKTERDVTALNPRNTQDIPGIWAKIKRSMGTVLQREFDSTRRFVLQAIEVELDPPAKAIREHYVYHLNQLMRDELNKSIGDVAKLTEADEISDYRVLIREILIRLVTVALSDKLDQLDPEQAGVDGNNITAVMKIFITGVKQNVAKLLVNEKGEITSLGRYLDGNQHAKSISNIDSIIWLLKELHAPRNTFSHCLNTLTKLERCIMGYLVAYFDKLGLVVVEPEQFEADQLLNAIGVCEEQVFNLNHQGTVIVNPNSDRELVALNEGSEKRKIILAILKKPNVRDKGGQPLNAEVIKKIEILYDLLDKTNLMLQAVSCFDTLITIGGWVPLLTNFIHSESLATLFDNFSNQCAEVLGQCEREKYGFAQKVSMALYSKFDTSGCLISLKVEIPKNIRNLDDQGLVRRILNLTATNIDMLTRLQASFKQVGLMEEKSFLIEEKSQGTKVLATSTESKQIGQQIPALQISLTSLQDNRYAPFSSTARESLTVSSSPNEQKRTTVSKEGEQKGATSGSGADISERLTKTKAMVAEALESSGKLLHKTSMSHT